MQTAHNDMEKFGIVTLAGQNADAILTSFENPQDRPGLDINNYLPQRRQQQSGKRP